MASYNKVTLLGNLTRQPEIKQAGSTQLANLGLAVNRRYTANGEKREEVTFVDIVFWGKLAETLQRLDLQKGAPILVDGRLQLDTWEDKQTGQKRSKLRVVGETFQLVGPRPQGAGNQGGEEYSPRANAPKPASRPATQQEDPGYGDEGDIPF